MQEQARNLKRSRVASLDVVRGIAVAGMVVVNNPGDWTAVFPPLLHAYWTGLTLADFVFPAFVFTMGMAVPFALGRRRATGASIGDLLARKYHDPAWHAGSWEEIIPPDVRAVLGPGPRSAAQEHSRGS